MLVCPARSQSMFNKRSFEPGTSRSLSLNNVIQRQCALPAELWKPVVLRFHCRAMEADGMQKFQPHCSGACLTQAPRPLPAGASEAPGGGSGWPQGRHRGRGGHGTNYRAGTAQASSKKANAAPGTCCGGGRAGDSAASQVPRRGASTGRARRARPIENHLQPVHTCTVGSIWRPPAPRAAGPRG